MAEPSSPGRTSPSEGAAHPDHAHLPGNWITAAEVMAGAPIPVRLNVRITLRPDGPAPKEPKETHGSSARRSPVTLERRLRKHSNKLLEWAKDNPENARVLLMDPLAAAGYAGVKLSPSEREALTDRVRARSLSDMLPPGVELVGLEVKTSTTSREDRGSKAKYRKEEHSHE